MASTTHPNRSVPCRVCGRHIRSAGIGLWRHMQTHPAACGCMRTARCAEATTLYARWQAGDRNGVLAAYRAHLRQAGVRPGEARWEETVLLAQY